MIHNNLQSFFIYYVGSTTSFNRISKNKLNQQKRSFAIINVIFLIFKNIFICKILLFFKIDMGKNMFWCPISKIHEISNFTRQCFLVLNKIYNYLKSGLFCCIFHSNSGRNIFKMHFKRRKNKSPKVLVLKFSK